MADQWDEIAAPFAEEIGARFARALRAAYQQGQRDEREQCAQVAENRIPAVQCMSVEPVIGACEDIAASIRSRSTNDA